MNDEEHVVTYVGYRIRPGDSVPVSFGKLGSFTLMLKNPQFHEGGKTVRSVEFIIAKNGT